MLAIILEKIVLGENVSIYSLLSRIAQQDHQDTSSLLMRSFNSYFSRTEGNYEYFVRSRHLVYERLLHITAMSVINGDSVFQIAEETSLDVLRKVLNKIQKFEPCCEVYNGQGTNPAHEVIYCKEPIGSHSSHRTSVNIILEETGLFGKIRNLFGGEFRDTWEGEFCKSEETESPEKIISEFVDDLTDIVEKYSNKQLSPHEYFRHIFDNYEIGNCYSTSELISCDCCLQTQLKERKIGTIKHILGFSPYRKMLYGLKSSKILNLC